MNTMNTLDILLLTATAALVVSIAYMIKAMFSRGGELERLLSENRKLKEEVGRLRFKLGVLEEENRRLRDTIKLRPTASALIAALRNGGLRKCFKEGGDVVALADGTLICEMHEKDKSYVISLEVKEPELKFFPHEEYEGEEE